MASCHLYHGPGAREGAIRKAASIGTLLAPPFGDDGLTTDDAREVVSLLLSTPMGEGVGTLVLGPMDDAASLKASDVLLKRIEEFDGTRVQPILWAHDLGGVVLTIRSRCLDHWCPTGGALTAEQEADKDRLAAVGWGLVDAAIAGEYHKIVVALRENSGKKARKEGGGEIALLEAVSDCLSTGESTEARRALWERVRRVTRWKNPTMLEIAAALIDG